MLSGQLLSELTKLNRTEKLRIVQLLVNELALEEASELQIGPQYEISSPFDAFEAAHTLQTMLDERRIGSEKPNKAD